ncbi:MAG: lipase family protein [Chitinophagaceae bacterium]
MLRYYTCFLFLALFSLSAIAQHLTPGFDKQECIEFLKIGAQVGDTAYRRNIADPENYSLVYRSPVNGLENRWDLWMHKNHQQAVISVRGTTSSAVSWLANTYAAMVPAKGYLQLSATDTFHYELATDPKAAVHVGWLISIAFLSKTILPQIDSCYQQGIKEFVITGHSQGGAICFLLTSYLYSLQRQHRIPADVRFKTYCMAAPKPGNLYYAYEYEVMTQYGWAYNVVSSADWVPEVPISVQTLNDYNTVNPFLNAKQMIRKQKFPKNLFLRHAYNRMDKPTRRSQRRFQRYLGKYMAKSVRKKLPGFVEPVYYKSNDYVRTGTTIVLAADSAYHQLYPDDPKQVFRHHHHESYIYLAEKLPGTPVRAVQ